jgi:hypothetical protein
MFLAPSYNDRGIKCFPGAFDAVDTCYEDVEETAE